MHHALFNKIKRNLSRFITHSLIFFSSAFRMFLGGFPAVAASPPRWAYLQRLCGVPRTSGLRSTRRLSPARCGLSAPSGPRATLKIRRPSGALLLNLVLKMPASAQHHFNAPFAGRRHYFGIANAAARLPNIGYAGLSRSFYSIGKGKKRI